MSLVRVEGVTKEYQLGDQNVVALHNITLSFEEGVFLAIAGPSGSGKTTLLNLLGALDQPSSGSIQVAGEELATLEPPAAARFRNRTIGFVFQLHYLLPQCTVLENVLVPRLAGGWAEEPAATRARAESLLEQVGLQDRLTHRPYQLSGGEQLRVAIARSLINQPKIILADEPTGSLDPATGERIAELFLRTNEAARVALVVVTHNPGLARRLHKTYRLVDGRLAE
jgi:ABC-type lipoprotein export system ATPase subunit